MSRLPIFTDFHDDGRYQAQARGHIGEQNRDPRSATNFTIEPLQAIDRPQRYKPLNLIG